MDDRKIEIIVKVYLAYSILLYVFIGIRFGIATDPPLSMMLLVTGLLVLIFIFNLLEVFSDESLQYRLYLLPHFILSILLYIFVYPIAGLEYYLVSIHLFSILLFERSFACYVEAAVIVVLTGLAKLYFLSGYSPDVLLQEYVMYAVFCGLMTLAMAVLMKYRSSIFVLQQDRGRLESVLVKMDVVNRNYRSYLVDVEADAMERERKRITRELHDIVGHAMITNISMLERISSMIDNRESVADVKKIIDTAYENATEGLEHSRELLYQFRTQVHQKMVGLIAVGQMVNIFQTATGMDVQQEYGECPLSFGQDIDDVLYHLIEESLMNSFRHGKAESVKVHVQLVNGSLTVDIQDDGIGAASIEEGLGLTGMRERVAALSGSLIVRGNYQGFRVSASIPYANRH